MTKKCSRVSILFMEECGNASLKIDWKIAVHAFCLVFYTDLDNKILKEVTWNILDRCYAKD